MIYFHNDEEGYVSWLERQPGGFVLNLFTGGKQRAMLHTTRCSHLYPINTTRVHTATHPKACSPNREELERWGLDYHYAVAPCPDCLP